MSDNADVKLLDKFVVQYNDFRNEISKIIVGQDEVVKEVLISIFCNGHCLLVGVPGLAKTLAITFPIPRDAPVIMATLFAKLNIEMFYLF